MCTLIIDYITGEEIYSKNPEKTVQERLNYHNSTFAYERRGIHYPSDAIAIYESDRIIIRKRR